MIDIGNVGDIFGKLTLLFPHDSKNNTRTIWTCLCECGEQCKATYFDLKKGKVKSCGCAKRKYPKDLTGLQFTNLKVIKSSNRSEKGSKIWECLCDCGTIIEVSRADLTNGHKKSCGCLKNLGSMTYTENISGLKINRLLVDGIFMRDGIGKFKYICICDCGETVYATKYEIEHGLVKSCGCYRSEMAKERLRKYQQNAKGENNPNWNPNLSDEDRLERRGFPEYEEWRRLVFKRDNYKCAICNDKTKLNAHHLFAYSVYKGLRLNINNGITLCGECHSKFHKLYNYKNNNFEQFIQFIRNKVTSVQSYPLEIEKVMELAAKERDVEFIKEITYDYPVIQEILLTEINELKEALY